MTRRTVYLLASAAVLLVATAIFVGLMLVGVSDEGLGFAYAVLLCCVSVGISQLSLRYDSKRRR